MLKTLLFATILALAACTTTTPPRNAAAEALFDDALFGAPTEPVGSDQIFALSDEMRRFAKSEILRMQRKRGLQWALVEALYHDGQLKLEYESEVTRNAAEAFEARAGNCLSLVIMTAAFARELGLEVRYQSAYLEELWSRKGDLLVRNGHVNITLGQATQRGRLSSSPGRDWYAHQLMIDFLPADELRGLRTVEIPESLVVAMYLNNRAVEALVRDRLDDAYAWAREAIRADAGFQAAQNTLGVVYMRRNALDRARQVFSHLLERDQDYTRALANLAEVARRQGNFAEAQALGERLARLEPEAPLHFLNLGLAAIRREDFRAAVEYLSEEAAHGDATAEVHFWLAVAHQRLGDAERAMRELSLAVETSTSRGERDLYAAKRDRLRGSRPAQR